MLELDHPGSSSRLGMCACIFLNLVPDLTGAILLFVGDVSADSDVPVVTSSISRICRLNCF